MYIYYVLRGTQQGQLIEHEDDINAEIFPDIDLSDGPLVVTTIATALQDAGATNWTECNLLHDYTDREDSYVYHNNHWIRRSEIPLTDTK